MRDDDEICKNREDVRRCLHRTFSRWKKNRVSKSVRWLAVACGGQPRCGSCGGVSDGFDGFAGAFDVGGEVGSEDAEGLDGGGGVADNLSIGNDGCFCSGYGVVGCLFGVFGSLDGEGGVFVVFGVV